MNLTSIIVTNCNQPAPNDLVVLDINPQEVDATQKESILALDWFQPDGNFYSQARFVLVSWNELNKIVKCTPQAPADYGCDPLEAVKYINKDHRVCDNKSFYSNFE